MVSVYVEAAGTALQLVKGGVGFEVSFDEAVELANKLVSILKLKPILPKPQKQGQEVVEESDAPVVDDGPIQEDVLSSPKPVESSSKLAERAKKMGQKPMPK